MTILVVDDDVWQADHYARELRRAGYKVVVAHHAYDAIAQIDTARPSLILLDLMLPGSNGIALLHELQSHTDLAAIPVIIASSQPPKASLAPYGVVAVIDKTTATNDELIGAIRKALS